VNEIVNAFSRRVVGWRAATSMTTDLVLDALEHAFFTRTQERHRPGRAHLAQ